MRAARMMLTESALSSLERKGVGGGRSRIAHDSFTRLHHDRTLAYRPNLNAYAERFVRSIKSECLERMIFFGEQHLHVAIKEYIKHYHLERNHQGIENQLIEMPTNPANRTGPLSCRSHIGGMLNFYHRDAA